jgi:hypothetical protein
MKNIIMTYKYIFLGFYLMAIPLSILIFSDFIIMQNKLYTILHILLCCIYFTTFYLFVNLRQNKPMQVEAEIETIPSAPVMFV